MRRPNPVPRDAPLVMGHLDRNTPVLKIDYTGGSSGSPGLYLCTEAGVVIVTESGSVISR